MKGDFTVENNINGRQLLQAVNEASFYMQDLQLYLDTHPNDMTAIGMFKEAAKQYKACKEAFECACYPLNAESSREEECWDWLRGAWPPQKL